MVPLDRAIIDWGGTVLVSGEPAAREVEAFGVNLKLAQLKSKVNEAHDKGVRLSR